MEEKKGTKKVFFLYVSCLPCYLFERRRRGKEVGTAEKNERKRERDDDEQQGYLQKRSRKIALLLCNKGESKIS